MRAPRSRRAVLGALTALLTCCAPFLLGHAAAAPAPTTVDRMVTVHDGPTGTHVATLATRLYLPVGLRPGQRTPAVLVTHGFGGSENDPQVVRWATFLADHGYLVLTWTAQGFGTSSGCITLDQLDYDAHDVSQLITKVLAPLPQLARDAHGPIVGMVGESYAGGIQPLVAETDPRVRAIVPFWSWISLQQALMPNDRVPPHASPTALAANPDGVFKFGWTSELFADGNAQPAQGHGGCPQQNLADPTDPAAASCPGFLPAMCQAYVQTAATGSLSAATRALLADSSGGTFLSHLRVPTLLVQGEPDTLFPLEQAVATYESLRAAHVPTAMIWSSDGHGGYPPAPGEGTFESTDNLNTGYVSQRVLAWFARYLRGQRVPTGPSFAYYEDWAPATGAAPDTEQFGTAATFPFSPTQVFELTGGPSDTGDAGGLVPYGLSAFPGSFTFQRFGVPAYSETPDCTGPAAGTPCPPGGVGALPATEVPGEWVSFTSAPFAAPVISVGQPAATLHLAHTASTDLIVFAKVYDVAPDGSQTLVDRQVAPVRVPNAALAAPVQIRLPAFAHRFAAGHRVELALSATDAGYDLGTAGGPDSITVSFGATHRYASDPQGQIESVQPDPDASSFTLPMANPEIAQPWY